MPIVAAEQVRTSNSWNCRSSGWARAIFTTIQPRNNGHSCSSFTRALVFGKIVEPSNWYKLKLAVISPPASNTRLFTWHKITYEQLNKISVLEFERETLFKLHKKLFQAICDFIIINIYIHKNWLSVKTEKTLHQL